MKKLAITLMVALGIFASSAQASPASVTWTGPNQLTFHNVSPYNMLCKVVRVDGHWFRTPVIAPGYTYTVYNVGAGQWQCWNV